MLRATTLCRLYKAVNKPVKLKTSLAYENRRKTLLRDHSVPEVTLKACPQHTQSQLYLRPSPLEDLKDLPDLKESQVSEASIKLFLEDLKKVPDSSKDVLATITIIHDIMEDQQLEASASSSLSATLQ